MDHFLSKLYSRINYELKIRVEPREFKLYNIRSLLARVGNPHLRYPVIHVAGTKGKGSVATMSANILTASGRKTGLFTSPHLQRINQRIVIDGKPISDQDFETVLAEFDPQIAAMDELCKTIRETRLAEKPRPNSDHEDWLIPDPQTGLPLTGNPLTFFEIMTAAAMLHFANRKCDAVVLEVGLGGRLDSTNVCQPAVSVITNISLDHTRQLGTTVDKIAFEKAGIIKLGVPVVCGSNDPDAVEVIENVATERGADLFLLGRDFAVEDKRLPEESTEEIIKGQVAKEQVASSSFEFNCQGKLNFQNNVDGSDPEVADQMPAEFDRQGLRVAMLGQHQRVNAALAVTAIEVLNAHQDWGIGADAISKGLLASELDGRGQVIGTSPTVVLDVAHNVASANVLLQTLESELTGWSTTHKKSLILAISTDKDYEGILQVLLPAFDQVWITKYQNNPRGVDAAELFEIAAKVAQQQSLDIEIDIAPTPVLAWQAAIDSLQPKGLLCCTGSVFLVAELIDLAKARI